MLVISKCLFDSVADSPYEGFIRIEDGQIFQVEKGVPDIDILHNQKKKNEKILDVGKRTVMPGFCDNHVHVYLAGLSLLSCNLDGCTSEMEAAERLYEYSKGNDDEWIIGFGWCHYDWKPEELPKKASLDNFFPDKPVMVINDELHALWVNSKALEYCHISSKTKDPEYGKIYRDSNGEPTGYILEQSAMKPFFREGLSFDKDREKELIEAFNKRANEVGITSVGDMEIVDIMKEDLYKELEESGKLKIRIFFSPSLKRPLTELIETKTTYNSDIVSMIGAKGFIDGTPLGYTGMLVEEYHDRPGFYGDPVVDLIWLREKILELNNHSISVRLHACGDRAVRIALDDIEYAQIQSAQGKLRNTIEHIENIHPSDIRRFLETSTIASIQPYHMSMNNIEGHQIFNILGSKRSKLAWPAKTLSDHGAHVALGTDCPIVPLDPFQTLYSAINRVMEDGSPMGGFNPKEKYSLSDALKRMTYEGAYLYGKEDKIGTLEKGKHADVIVLSENIFEKAPLDVKEVKVDTTIWNGEIVFCR
jgi:predicted amidohydrolase YtcJ